MSKTKERIAISLDKDVVERIESLRGLVKRSTYINSLLRIVLNLNGNGKDNQ